MGRALKNLDYLLQMPSGCGEQNMIILAPNIYILQYLEDTAQLTPTIRQTAIGYLQSGTDYWILQVEWIMWCNVVPDFF